MDDAARPRDALVAIDLLRFCAAAIVMLFHYFNEWAVVERIGVGTGSGPSGLPTNEWLSSGWIGVEIFFVISGYVIALSATNSTASDFARRRLLRLWPGALVCATITTAVLVISGLSWDSVAPRYAASALMVLWADQIDPVYWSLLVECIFYALVTLLLAIGRWNAVRAALALSAWTLIYLALVLRPAAEAMPAVISMAEVLLAPFGAFFAMGILFQQAHRDPASVKGWMFLPSFLAAPICISAIATVKGNDGPGEALMMFVAGIAVIILSPRIQLAFRSEQVRRVAIALGLATYPFYLIHHYVGQAMMVGAAKVGVAPGVSVGPVTLLIVGLSLFVALRVEPMLRSRMDLILRPILRMSPRPAA